MQVKAINHLQSVHQKLPYLPTVPYYKKGSKPHLHGNETLSKMGAKTVHTSKFTPDTKRSALALIATLSKKLLSPVMVAWSFWNVLSLSVSCMDRQEIDAILMENVLKLYSVTTPHHIPVLFLDSYQWLWKNNFAYSIQVMGVEVEHITGECNGFFQATYVRVDNWWT